MIVGEYNEATPKRLGWSVGAGGGNESSAKEQRRGRKKTRLSVNREQK